MAGAVYPSCTSPLTAGYQAQHEPSVRLCLQPPPPCRDADGRAHAPLPSALCAVIAVPAVLHFAGFKVGQVQRRVVQLCNTSDQCVRVHVVPPPNPLFKVSHTCTSAGGLAPGLSEQVVVEFTAQAPAVESSFLLVTTQAGSLEVPIHAYPTMGGADFPRRIDFGRVALGEGSTRRVVLNNEAPVAFEYSVATLRPNPAFTVAPASGNVPPGGRVAVEVCFAPRALVTQEVVLCLTTGQAADQPQLCTVTGSAAPGVAQERAAGTSGASSASSSSRQPKADKGAAPSQQHARSSLRDAPRLADMSPGFNQCVDIMNAPAPTPYQHLPPTLQPEPYQHLPPTLQPELLRGVTLPSAVGRPSSVTKRRPKPPEAPPQEQQVGGVFLPNRLDAGDHSSVAYVLNQREGKLRTKDVQAAILIRKAEQVRQREQLAALLVEGDASGVHPLDQPALAASIKAAVFDAQLAESQAKAKRSTGLVGAAGGVLGEDVPTPEQVARTLEARRAAVAAHQSMQEEQRMRRRRPRLEAAGALHVACQQPSTAEQAAVDGGACTGGDSYPGLEGFQPSFLMVQASEWRKRVHALRRFVTAARTVVYRLRAQKRLDRLKMLAEMAVHSSSHATLDTLVEEVLLSEGHQTQRQHCSRPGVEPTQLLDAARVTAPPLPLFCEQLLAAASVTHAPVEVTNAADFEALTPLQPQVALEWQLLGYQPEPLHGFTPAMPPLGELPLLEGAGEEGPTCSRPNGLLPYAALAAVLGQAMPEAVRQMPFVALEIGSRYSTDAVLAAVPPSWGIDAAAPIQPRMYSFHDSSTMEVPGSGTLRALAGGPLLAQRWLPARCVLGGVEDVLRPCDPHVAGERRSSPTSARGEDDAACGPGPGTHSVQQAAQVQLQQAEQQQRVLPRQRQQRELDAAKQRSHTASVAEYVEGLVEYNAGLEAPLCMVNLT